MGNGTAGGCTGNPPRRIGRVRVEFNAISRQRVRIPVGMNGQRGTQGRGLRQRRGKHVNVGKGLGQLLHVYRVFAKAAVHKQTLNRRWMQQRAAQH